MTDQEFEDIKGRVRALLDEWAFGNKENPIPRMMLLKDWVVKVNYFREGSEETVDGDVAGASVTSVWYYKQAVMDFMCGEIYTLAPLELELLVIHELCHILVNEMREWGEGAGDTKDMHHEERVVTDLAMAFLQTKYYDKGTKSGEVG
jgi:hypothetical protein